TLDLRAIAEHVEAELVLGVVAEVAPEDHRVVTTTGRTLEYDVLVVAVGAQPVEPLPGALTFGGPADAEAFRTLLHDLHVGVAQHAVFAVPTGTSWSLPLYDLALSTAARLRTL